MAGLVKAFEVYYKMSKPNRRYWDLKIFYQDGTKELIHLRSATPKEYAQMPVQIKDKNFFWKFSPLGTRDDVMNFITKQMPLPPIINVKTFGSGKDSKKDSGGEYSTGLGSHTDIGGMHPEGKNDAGDRGYGNQTGGPGGGYKDSNESTGDRNVGKGDGGAN